MRVLGFGRSRKDHCNVCPLSSDFSHTEDPLVGHSVRRSASVLHHLDFNIQPYYRGDSNTKIRCIFVSPVIPGNKGVSLELPEYLIGATTQNSVFDTHESRQNKWPTSFDFSQSYLHVDELWQLGSQRSMSAGSGSPHLHHVWKCCRSLLRSLLLQYTIVASCS